MKKYVAYEGSEFTIEWYHDEKGISSPQGFYNKQPMIQKRKLLNLFRLMGEQEKIFDKTKFVHERDKIYAFKPQPDRYLCFFFEGKKIIVTNAYVKKSQKLPKGEKDIALKAYENYVLRITEEMYYEKEN